MTEFTSITLAEAIAVERERQIALIKSGGTRPRRRELPPNATERDEARADFIHRQAIAKQATARRTPDVSVFWGQRDMSTTTNADLVESGNLASVMTRSRARLPALGPQYLSRKITDQNFQPFLNGKPVTQHLLEGEDVTPGDLATSADQLDPKTIGTAVPMTRRQIKQSPERAQLQIATRVTDSLDVGAEAAVINGDSTGTGGREPDGLEKTLTNTLVDPALTPSTIGKIVRELLDAYQNPASFGAMIESGLFETLLSTPVETGTDSRVIRRSSGSATGYVLSMGDDDDGIPCAPSAAMTANTSIIGAWDQLEVIYNESVDLMFLRSGAAAGPSGKTILYAFLDYDYNVRDQNAFWLVKAA